MLGSTRAAIKKRLYEGGLRIYTNYDPVMEFEANLSISGIIPQNQSQFTGALVAIDNSNGAVRAVSFGRGYNASQFDPAVDGPGRQAGSSFKGITLATALASGYSPDDRVSGGSLTWQIGPGQRQRLLLPPLGRLPRRRPDAHRGDRDSPTTARSCAPSCRWGRATTAATACGT